MTRNGQSPGWNGVDNLIDGDTGTKAYISSAGTGKYVQYSIPSSTIETARFYEDNTGSWEVDDWKMEYLPI